MNSTVFRAVGAASVIVALLAGCTSAPEVSQGKPTEASSPTPTATDTPSPFAAVTSIVVRPEALELMDSSGTLVAALSYDAEVGSFVDALSALAGAEPSVTEYTAGSEVPARTEYSWGDFVVSDDHEVGDRRQDMNLSVTFLQPTIGGHVSVATIQGWQPGGDLGELARQMDEPYTGSGFDQIQAEHGDPIGPQTDGFTYSNSNSVTGINYHGTTAIFAPFNFGIGHV